MSDSTWRSRLAAHGRAVRLATSASPAAVEHLVRALGVALPDAMRELLLDSDGVADRYGAWIVWPAAEIARRNEEFRTKAEFRQLYMPFDAMLFFGEAGNGDHFFYRVLDGVVREPDVYIWEHETDNRVWRAPRLDAFLTAQLTAAGG